MPSGAGDLTRWVETPEHRNVCLLGGTKNGVYLVTRAGILTTPGVVKIYITISYNLCVGTYLFDKPQGPKGVAEKKIVRGGERRTAGSYQTFIP